MDRLENFLLLDPNSCELINVEETAIVNFVGGHMPEAQAIGLVLQQLFKPVETTWVAFDAINFCKRCVNGGSDVRTGFGQRPQSTLDHSLLPQALFYSPWVGLGTQRQIGEGGDYAR